MLTRGASAFDAMMPTRNIEAATIDDAWGRSQYRGQMRLKRILETVLYFATGEEEELARFYADVLGLQAVGNSGLTFRVGDGVLLLFDAGLASAQSSPPPHGAHGPVHTCFIAEGDEYDDWKQRIADSGGSILEEIVWENGFRSFYFRDPAGNVLEIAERSLAGDVDDPGR